MVFVIIHTPWPTSKGFDHPFCMSMLACFYALSSMLASLVLGFTMFGALYGHGLVWLHLMPTRPCSGVTTWDVSLDARSLYMYPSRFPLHAIICLPCLFVPPVGFICIFTCLLICSCIWVFLASVLSVLKHNEVMDIRSKPTFVPRGYHLLFVFFFFFTCLLAMHIVLICFMPFYMFVTYFPFIDFLLVSCHCLCMYAHRVRTLGARARSPRCKQKGSGCEHVDMSQMATVNRFRSLAFPFDYVLF